MGHMYDGLTTSNLDGPNLNNPPECSIQNSSFPMTTQLACPVDISIWEVQILQGNARKRFFVKKNRTNFAKNLKELPVELLKKTLSCESSESSKPQVTERLRTFTNKHHNLLQTETELYNFQKLKLRPS